APFQPLLALGLTLSALALAVAAVVAYVALSPPAGTPEIVPANSSAPLGSTSSGRLQVQLGGVDLQVHADSSISDLYQARFGFPSGQVPHVQVNGGTVTVNGAGGPRFGFLSPPRRTVDLTLNGSIPWDVQVGGGASQTRLHLRGLD